MEFQGKQYNDRHGGPFDRGSADSYYGRIREPHFYVGGTAMSRKVEMVSMTEREIQEYNAGYDWNEQFGGKKEY